MLAAMLIFKAFFRCRRRAPTHVDLLMRDRAETCLLFSTGIMKLLLTGKDKSISMVLPPWRRRPRPAAKISKDETPVERFSRCSRLDQTPGQFSLRKIHIRMHSAPADTARLWCVHPPQRLRASRNIVKFSLTAFKHAGATGDLPGRRAQTK